MIYIVVALYIEAELLIKKINLKKENLVTKFQIFKNENIILIVSGVGRLKSAIATTYLLSNYENSKDDYIINIGFCGTNSANINIGDVVVPYEIRNPYSNKSFFLDMIYKHNFIEGRFLTFDKVMDFIDEKEETFVDMEAYGYFEASSYYFSRENILALKLVSDKLENSDKENKKVNIAEFEKAYEAISEFILNLSKTKKDSFKFNELENEYIKKIGQKLRLSDTMTYEFISILKYLKLIGKDILSFLKEYENIEIKSKLEGKVYFEEFKKKYVK